MTYPGGKNGSGVYQRIINHMPPHDVYIEGFCGSGAVLRNKRPAKRNIAIDLDLEALNLARELAGERDDVEWVNANSLEVLKSMAHKHLTLAYFDPPYVMESRKGGDLYNFEMSDEDHYKLIYFAIDTPWMVMISGYRNSIYDGLLFDWHRIDYQTMTRQGMVDESLWMNFEPPNQLHDYSYLGENYRERERIKKKKARFQSKFEKMDRLERLAIMEVLTNEGAQELP